MSFSKFMPLVPFVAIAISTLVPETQSTFLAGVSGQGTNPERITTLGGNSLRIYYPNEFTDALKKCDHGLNIVLGLGVEPHMDSATAIKHALEVVEKVKHLPCVTSYVVANEMETRRDASEAFYIVEQVASQVKAVDNKKVTACIAGDSQIMKLQAMAPSLDYPCINCYLCADYLCESLKQKGFHGDYMLGEYGVHGWWETDETSWGAPIEPSSTDKARTIVSGFQGGAQCSGGPNPVGAMAFVDSNGKNEVTPTWFPLSNFDGEPSADRYFTLGKIWRGEDITTESVRDLLKENNTPQVEGVRGPGAVRPGEHFSATVHLGENVDATPFVASWEIRYDTSIGFTSPVTEGPIGMEVELQPVVSSATSGPANGGLRGSTVSELDVTIQAPETPGPYRLFVFVRKDDNPEIGFATANLPFLVQ